MRFLHCAETPTDIVGLNILYWEEQCFQRKDLSWTILEYSEMQSLHENGYKFVFNPLHHC